MGCRVEKAAINAKQFRKMFSLTSHRHALYSLGFPLRHSHEALKFNDRFSEKQTRMKLVKLFLVIAALTLFIIACSTTNTPTVNHNLQSPNANGAAAATTNVNAPTPVDEFADARAIFNDRCADCHGAGGEGGIVKTKRGSLKVPNLKTGHAVTHTDEQLAKQITNGGDGMPAFKDKLHPDEINNLVRFIHHEFQNKDASGQTTTATPKS
jgi:mono/diheme cytochrome c family protein